MAAVLLKQLAIFLESLKLGIGATYCTKVSKMELG